MARRLDDRGDFAMPWEADPYTTVRERPVLSDQDQKRQVLLVDRKGDPLIVREPRPVGFRKR